MKIAFVGVPSSGKTTMAEKVAKATGGTFIPETARVVIEAMDRIPTKEDQKFIMRMQSRLEETMTTDLMVCDIPIFVNHVYYRLYHGNDDECRRLYEIAKKHSYDYIFWLCPLPYRDDGVRYQTKEELEELERMFDEYQEHFGKYTRIHEKNLNKRIKFVLDTIKLNKVRKSD